MSLETILESFGLSENESTLLVENAYFHHKEKTREEFQTLFENIARAYSCSQAEVIKAILAFPPFAGLNHERVVREGTEVYHDEKAVKKAILAFPPFAGYDHERVVREGTEVYHDEKAVKKAILAFPPFAGLNHERVVREGTEVYHDEKAVKKAILAFPQFAGLNHERVVRRIERLGRLVGKSKDEAREVILKRPAYAGYSAKRYLAAIDIGRKLHAQGQPPELLFRAFSAYYGKSPYVPGTRLRISKIAEYEKPPLMIAMENYNKKPLVRNH